MDDHAFDNRLRALEVGVPVTSGPPPVGRAPKFSRGRTILVAAAAVVVLAGGTAASGVFEAKSTPGAFNRGQPLHCSGIAKMAPREAEAWLDAHGYDDVTWQVEDRTPGVPKGQQRSEKRDTAPSSGKIAAATFVNRTQLIVVVETGSGAIRADDCP